MAQFKELPQVGFSEAAQNLFKKMFQFNGRIRRSEYWWGFLTFIILSFVLSIIPFVGPFAVLFMIIGAVSMLFRRLHDTGRSGWWWGAQACIGLVAAALFASAIDFYAYVSAIRANDVSEMMRVLGSAMSGSTGLLALLCYLANMVLGLVIFVFTLFDSQPQDNKYGKSPKYVAN